MEYRKVCVFVREQIQDENDEFLVLLGTNDYTATGSAKVRVRELQTRTAQWPPARAQTNKHMATNLPYFLPSLFIPATPLLPSQAFYMLISIDCKYQTQRDGRDRPSRR
jgi:hypothetical protein